jgi:putative flippase GtrA
MTLIRQNIFSDGLRFLIAGGLNTLISFCLYQFLLLFLTHGVAYTICWIAGIVFIAVFYPSRVFPGSIKSKKRIIATIISYVVIFALGLWFLDQLVASGINPRIAIFAVLILSATLNFISMRLLLRISIK